MSGGNMLKTFEKMCQAQSPAAKKNKQLRKKRKSLTFQAEKKTMDSVGIKKSVRRSDAEDVQKLQWVEAEKEEQEKLAQVRQKIAKMGVTGLSVGEVMNNLHLTSQRTDAEIQQMVKDKKDFSPRFGHLPLHADEVRDAAKHYAQVTEDEDLKTEIKKLFGWGDEEEETEGVGAGLPSEDDEELTPAPKTRPDDGSGSGEKISLRLNLGVDGLSAA